MIVVADTSPLNYLVLTGCENLLPQLFGTILVPRGVIDELSDAKAPDIVRDWVAQPHDWLEIRLVSEIDPGIGFLGRGEQEGITLAQCLNADLILIDDAPARHEAEKRSLTVTGTLGILKRAALLKLINLPHALAKLQSTNFFIARSVVEGLLKDVNEQ
jgi:predicted nucleic acid-binding protein